MTPWPSVAQAANNVQVMMGLGCVVVAIFSAILLFYTNSFVMKRRQHELGLYSILGMETRHIARATSGGSAVFGAVQPGFAVWLPESSCPSSC